MRITSIQSQKIVSFGELGGKCERFTHTRFENQENLMLKRIADCEKFTYDEVFKLLQPNTLKERLMMLKEMHMDKLTKMISKIR